MRAPSGRGRWCATASRSSGCRSPSAGCTAASPATRPSCSSRSTRRMTLLVISPDYASHLLPLATLATAWRDRGERVVVAGGPATAGIVAGFGFERRELRLGRGSNPGVITTEHQPVDEGDSLRGFFEATRRGAVPTLSYQAAERLTDLMWRPVEAARATQRIVDECRPRRDHRRPPRVQRAARPHHRRDPVWRHRAGTSERAPRRLRGVRVPADVAGRLPARCRRARGAAPTLPAGLGALHRGMEPRRAGARARCPARAATRSPSTARWCSTTTPRSSPTSSVAPCCRRTASWGRRAATSRRTPGSRPGSPRRVRSST